MYFVAFIVYINHRFLDSWGPTALVPPSGVKHMTPYPIFQSIKKLLDVNKINSLGWKHKVDLKNGIEKTLEWVKSNDYQMFK